MTDLEQLRAENARLRGVNSRLKQMLTGAVEGPWREHQKEEARAALSADPAPVEFQTRVADWMDATFGEEISNDVMERNHRFLEEALELVQSLRCTKHEAVQLVDYVFGRETGDPMQEVGGVMVTLAAMCAAANLDMQGCGEAELARVWEKKDAIRAKQAAKPKHSPLPADPAPVGDTWQPIETAPRDGTWFWVLDDCDAISVRWHDKFQAFVASWREMTFAESYGGEVRLHSPDIRTPTYWMPRPPLSAGENGND